MAVARIPFRAEEESVLSQLGIWMLVIAIFHFIGGGLLLLASCIGVVGGAAATVSAGARGILLLGGMLLLFALALVLIGQGVLLVLARGQFQKVVATDEADQHHLSQGFKWLKIFFFIEIAVGLVGILGNVVEVVGAAIGGGPTGAPPMGGGL